MSSHYTRIARIFHWLMAVLIIGMLAMGLKMTSIPSGPDKLWVYGLHKSTGLLILMLAVARVTWRFTHPAPLLPQDLPRWMKAGAHAGHFALYACMFAMPLTGWAMSSAAGYPVSFYGQFVMPGIVPANPDMRHFYAETHEIIAYGLMGLIAVHAGAALYHHFLRKDDILRRMLWMLLAAVAAGGAVSHAKAQEAPAHFLMTPEKSYLRFVATMNNAPVECEIKSFQPEIFFSPDKPEESHITVLADLKTTFCVNADVMNELPKPDWFNVEKYPAALLKLSELKRLPSPQADVSQQYYGDAELTIRETTVKTPVSFVLEKYDGREAIATGQISLLRTAFGVGQGEWKNTDAVRDVVTVKFRVVASRAPK